MIVEGGSRCGVVMSGQRTQESRDEIPHGVVEVPPGDTAICLARDNNWNPKETQAVLLRRQEVVGVHRLRHQAVNRHVI